MKISFSNMPVGNYTARLLSTNGALLLSKQLTISTNSSMETLIISKKLAAGNYLLEIVRPDKTTTVERLIISN